MNQHPAPCREVLFLGTDNHYRSRYAEIVFNHAARLGSIPWRARSRGLVLDLLHRTPVSPFVRARLRRIGIEPEEPLRWPIEIEERDLIDTDHIIAMDLTEHRPLIRCQHLQWDSRIEYWDVGDTDALTPGTAFDTIDREIAHLLRVLTCAA
jgi:protein-tyrosine phosphatase